MRNRHAFTRIIVGLGFGNLGFDYWNLYFLFLIDPYFLYHVAIILLAHQYINVVLAIGRIKISYREFRSCIRGTGIHNRKIAWRVFTEKIVQHQLRLIMAVVALVVVQGYGHKIIQVFAHILYVVAFNGVDNIVHCPVGLRIRG